jgi:hypothetical protein
MDVAFRLLYENDAVTTGRELRDLGMISGNTQSNSTNAALSNWYE